MKRLPNIVLVFVLAALFVLSYKTGRSVFEEFDGQVFSHGSVPIETSTSFLVLLASMGVILGILIKDSNKISQIIMMWPWVHLLGLFGLLVIGGIISEYILSLVFMSIVLLPMNLIGEGISLGFLFTRLFTRKNWRFQTIGLIIINLLIIGAVLLEMSKESHAEFFM
ncbi:hypothetical protein [Paenibacillus sp. sgz5001063]|uniref:hypothetical protein n=1 Tax=Paenibacillus sp. sgz5001063 TaxID=3242474 RepID=UPI0036D2AD41